jgi:crotonobetainyl-CoA:carnitine CoA-transferase CaiB-like acyl-CoA transferase
MTTGEKQPFLPLQGIKVLELGHIVAGPTAGQILGDLGAEVIKVEPIVGGDRVRSMKGATKSMFFALNRNKRSITIDLKGEGREIFERLARDTDVIVDNFAFGAVERLGIGFEDITKIKPSIIWLAIKGFLPGPLQEQPMLDELAQMAGGLAFMTGNPGEPMRAGASVVDIGAATYGIIAVLAALLQRKNGDDQGRYIVAGLFETSVYWVSQWMAAAQFSGEKSKPMPEMRQESRMSFAVYRLFDTADDRQIFIGIVSDAHWRRFCAAFRLADSVEDPKFVDDAARNANRTVLADLIRDVIATHSLAKASELLGGAKVPFAPVNRPDELTDNIQLRQTGQLVESTYTNGNTGMLPKLPFNVAGFDMPVRKQAPALGEDTHEILEACGYSREQIDDWRQRGVIGG